MRSPTELAAEVERLAAARVLCVGDLMLDRFVYGNVSRISPEGPVPVLDVTEQRTALGGVGNVVHNLVTLGSRVSSVSVAGEDSEAAELDALLAALGGGQHLVLRDSSRVTTVKTRCIGGHQQIVRLDRETPKALSEAFAARVLERVETQLEHFDVLVLSDYGKGTLGARVLPALIAAANRCQRPIVVDPKGTEFSRYRGASVVTPNRLELARETGLPVDTDEQVAAAARSLIERCGIDSVLVTRSERGMSLVGHDQEGTHVPTYAQEVYDVSGAGDTVVAVFAAARAVGIDGAEATRLANAAAGIAVAKLGTAAVSALELLSSLQSGTGMRREEKVLSRARLLSTVAEWRARGFKVGFTNGCFDLLHPGHVSLLGRARELCDRLVVALNNDGSVRRLKGDSRPIQSEDARATILASLTDVDALVLFGEDTPIDLIAAVRPDVLVKGADYSIDEVVGADLVQANGGRVELIDLLDGHSTTAILGRSEKG